MLALCRLPPPPPPPPSLAVATPVVVATRELQELLLVREEELTWREEALATREEKARVSENALTKISVNLDKMVTHTARAKHSLGLNKILGEENVEHDGREQDLNLCEATLKDA
jgi:hypothetical protein